jgi:hypothetical protein
MMALPPYCAISRNAVFILQGLSAVHQCLAFRGRHLSRGKKFSSHYSISIGLFEEAITWCCGIRIRRRVFRMVSIKAGIES